MQLGAQVPFFGCAPNCGEEKFIKTLCMVEWTKGIYKLSKDLNFYIWAHTETLSETLNRHRHTQAHTRVIDRSIQFRVNALTASGCFQ